MRIASRDLRVVTVGLVSAVLLAGCSGNSSEPTVLPPLTTSVTPVAATTPAPARATTPVPAPTTTPAPATTPAMPTSATTTPTPTTPTPTTASAGAPNPSQGDPAVSAKMIAVVKNYYVVANSATHAANLLPNWRGLFSDSCRACVTDYNIIKKELGLGVKYVGGGYQLEKLKPISWNDKGGILGISFVTKAGKAFDKSGKQIDSLGTSKLRKARISVEKQGSLWFVVLFDEAPE